MSISDRLDQIAARADAATEGPWGFIADTNLIGMAKEWRIGSTEAMADVAATPRFGTDSADAEFIAASRSDVPALVAAVRAVLAYVDYCDDEGWSAWPDDIRRAIATALGEGE